MIERKTPRSAKIGIFAVAHHTYFQQFEGLYENLCGYHKVFCDMVEESGVEIVDLGIIDSNEKAFAAAGTLRGANVDRFSAT